jgi:hypothetical protein
MSPSCFVRIGAYYKNLRVHGFGFLPQIILLFSHIYWLELVLFRGQNLELWILLLCHAAIPS